MVQKLHANLSFKDDPCQTPVPPSVIQLQLHLKENEPELAVYPKKKRTEIIVVIKNLIASIL